MDLVSQVNLAAVHQPAPGLAIGAVGVAVVGLGYAGRHHLERLNLRDDFRVEGAFDTFSPAAHKAAGLFPRTYGTWNEVLADDAVELVVLATPPATHAALAIEALHRGKHVLVETPLCLDVQGADAMVEAAVCAGRSLIVAGASAADHDFDAAFACLRSEVVGQPKAIKHLAWQYSPHRGADASAENEAPRGAWRDRWETGGGALWEFGALRIGQLLRLAGEFPESVYAAIYRPLSGATPEQEGMCIAADAANAADSTRALARHSLSFVHREPEAGFLLILHFPSGLIAHLEVCAGYSAPLQTGWAIAGTAGSYAQHTHFSITEDGEVVDIPVPRGQTSDSALYAGVAAHLRHGAPNPCSPVEARQVVSIVEAARESAGSGQPVPIGRTTAPS